MANEPTGTVPRNIKLRDNANPSLPSIFNNFFGLFLRIKQTVRTHLMQLRKFFTFDPETLILSQMPVEDVQLHGCHRIQVSFQDFWWFIMSTNVNQQSAPTKPGL